MKRKQKNPQFISLRGEKNKDFRVRVLKNERLIDSVQGLDAKFDDDMLDYGNMDDLPMSDKIMICQQKGIKQENCDREY